MKIHFRLTESFKNITTKGSDNLDVSTNEYGILWKNMQASLGKYIKQYGYYDVYVICAKHGHVLYTDAPGSFIGAPIKNESGKTVAVVAIQIPFEDIQKITGERTGLGETGQTYAVGIDHHTRSDTFHNKEKFSVKNSFAKGNKIKSETATLAPRGKEGVKEIIDFDGGEAISAYATVDLADDIRWALVTEIDAAEAYKSTEIIKNSLTIGIIITVIIVPVLGSTLPDQLEKWSSS